QIAEKYTALARDAQAAGDRVMAENYLQHAEHYNRIIAAAQGQMPIHAQRDYRDDEYEDELEAGYNGAAEKPAAAPDGSGRQPVIEGTPAEVALSEEVPAVNGASEEQPTERKTATRRPRRTRKARADEAMPEESGAAAADAPNGQEAAEETGEAQAAVNG